MNECFFPQQEGYRKHLRQTKSKSASMTANCNEIIGREEKNSKKLSLFEKEYENA